MPCQPIVEDVSLDQPARIRLTYASTATFQQQRDAAGIEVNVARILMQSRRNNARDRIGGVLHFGDGYFFQCLEGSRAAVNRTYSRIGEDPRHHKVQLLSLDEVGEGMFSDWSMKYVAIEKNIDAVLARFGIKGFDPYRFDKEVIDSLLEACRHGNDPTHASIPDPATGSGASRRRGFLGRLLGRH